ncbi:MAG: hypothetical protein L6R37_008452, partial [Teloschistes peruensis]
MSSSPSSSTRKQPTTLKRGAPLAVTVEEDDKTVTQPRAHGKRLAHAQLDSGSQANLTRKRTKTLRRVTPIAVEAEQDDDCGTETGDEDSVAGYEEDVDHSSDDCSLRRPASISQQDDNIASCRQGACIVDERVESITGTGRGTLEERRAIESSIRRLTRGNRTVKIVWGKAHIGIEGNERADEAAKEGTTQPEVRIITSGGLRQWDNALRKEERGGTDLGKRRIMDLSRKTVTNYTRCRTNRGPFKARSTTLGKATNDTFPDCPQPYGQTGEHIALHRDKFSDLRLDRLGDIRSWDGLDSLRGEKWIKGMSFFEAINLSY